MYSFSENGIETRRILTRRGKNPTFLQVLSLKKCFLFLILSENAIKMSANSLIVFENSLIVFLICQGENKICSIENKISPWEIEKKPILVMRQNCVISIRRSFSWILSHSRVLKMWIFFTNIFVLKSLVLLFEDLNYDCLTCDTRALKCEGNFFLFYHF